jgi:hypothetical protein
MCSITEPRRATVSCKNLFSSTNNDRSVPTSSSRRHGYNNSNTKRFNNNNNNNPTTRSTKQQQKLNDITNENLSHSNVFHVPFCFEQINDNGKKNSTNNTKLLRTSLNPLSPVFYSTRHIALVSEQKQDTISG